MLGPYFAIRWLAGLHQGAVCVPIRLREKALPAVALIANRVGLLAGRLTKTAGVWALYDLSRAGKYSDDLREKAVAEVQQRRLQSPLDRSIFRNVADEYGVGEQSLRLWVKKHDRGSCTVVPPEAVTADPAAISSMYGEIERLKRQIERLHAENEVLKKAFVVFSSKWGEE